MTNWPVSEDRLARGLYWSKPWNIVEGCTPVSSGCDNCWSATETHMRSHQANPKISGPKKGLVEAGAFTGQVWLREDQLDKPLRERKPRVYLVLNDLFHEDVPFDYILRALDRLEQTPWHTGLVLTKRPDRLVEFCARHGIGSGNSWPLNIIPGVSVEDQKTADERIPFILKFKAGLPYAKVMVSYEPAISQIDFSKWLKADSLETAADKSNSNSKNLRTRGLDWIIMGGESGPKARRRRMPHEWASDVSKQCEAAGVPLFYKQGPDDEGNWTKLPTLRGRKWMEVPA